MKDHYIKNTTLLFTYLLIVWGFYRLLFQFPDPFDELVIKPFIWLVPVYIFLKKENSKWGSVGLTTNNLFPSIYFSLLLGAVFVFEGFFINYLKYNGSLYQADIGPYSLYLALIISLVAAIVEEITFRGYLFTRLNIVLENSLKSNLVTSLLWTTIHLPLALLDWRLGLGPLTIYLVLVFIFGFCASAIFARTKNIVAPILLHILWAWPIILFR